MLRLGYAPRRGNSPELRSAKLAPRFGGIAALSLAQIGSVVLALAVPACSGSARAVRLPVAAGSPDVFRISCEKRISACRDKAEEVCRGAYEVLEATGASIEPERVSSTGPRSTGPRYQQAKWLGHMLVACGELAKEADADASLTDTTAAEASAPRAPALREGQLCVPGVTQECLGPGACRGAQACVADGGGYGPCDCGAVSPREPPPPAVRHSLADAGAPP